MENGGNNQRKKLETLDEAIDRLEPCDEKTAGMDQEMQEKASGLERTVTSLCGKQPKTDAPAQ